ncbi:hypothetical protein OsJ_00929 [Oryza sativa Japonica Group]|uniref:Uncharacterized protein n=1 Tax=Oryza sativa subsp. japonica TaxID=39947 RepID=B9EU58_ORYSJ|nr:hypothetical protein OsJ_00929 [Oryza sativa Japonica Group]
MPPAPAPAPPPSPFGATTPSSASATPSPTRATTPSSSAAERLGVPLLPPFLAYNGSFRRGANFAVGAATALDSSIFHAGDPPPGASPFPVNTSLGVQLGWFESLKPSLCSTTQGKKKCKDFFGRSLFFVGEFGFNDYEFFFRKKSMEEIRSFVPYIIETISIAIEVIII